MLMRLVFEGGSRAGTEITTSAPLIRIGSDKNAADLVLDGSDVSPRHCLLQRSPRGAYILEDLGTEAGTYVNDQKVHAIGRPTAIYLSPGDRFRIGDNEAVIGEGVARLMVTSGPKAGRELPVDDQPITIGRAPDNVLDFEDADVSVYHAAILALPTGYVLQDNGSTNGTSVNGHPIERHVLADGDTIEVGNHQLRFLIDAFDIEDIPSRSLSGTFSLGESAHQLVFISGPHEGVSLPLGEGQQIFGRRPDLTFTLDDPQVSGMHCGITEVDGEYHLTDLQSSNGTTINGERVVETTKLAPGDLIEIGLSVLEYRITGGMPTGAGLTTVMTTVIAEGAYEVSSQPKFIINGHVESAHEILIGRATTAELRFEGAGVSTKHAIIRWEDGFVLEDQSTYGTYLNDRRIVREKLHTGHVIRVGENVIEVTIRGERCTLEVIDKYTALAAIQVARENAFNLANAELDHANIGGAGVAAYRTVFKLELPNAEALVQERKAKFKVGAPAWRPSTDITSDSVGKVAVLSAVVSAVAIVAILYGTGSADALINHPLSEAHSSAAFVNQAGGLGLDGCESCHSAGSGIPDRKCAACHAGFEQGRAAHATTTTSLEPHRRLPGTTCTACHNEHRGAPRFSATGSPSYLGAGSTCSDSACHPNQHTAEFLREGPPPPLVLKAGPVPRFDLSQGDFHVAHAEVTQGDKQVSIGCTSCHASKTDAGLTKAVPGKSCFRCHEGGEEFVNSQCQSCHRDEHGGADLHRLPVNDAGMVAAISKPTAGRSLLVGGALALAAFLPLAGLGLLLRVRRRRRSEQVVEHIQAFPVETIKRLVHSINLDKCVGCSMCVSACPASVLELVNHKSVVVNFDSCIQCKKCEHACAFDALRMHDADKPPPMIKMPEIDNYYQTRIPGMYLIGQAAGTPQVKNAINLGRTVIQHIAMDGTKPGVGHQLGGSADVIIAGSGPAGLSAAVTCARMGYSYLLLEKQRNFSWTIRNYFHKGKPVMAEPNHVEMQGFVPHWDTVREDLLAAWEATIKQYGVQIQYMADVTNIEKNGELFSVSVTDSKGNPVQTYTSAKVVLAIGTMGNPRKLGCPGDDMEKVANALVDPDEFRGRNILIVGGTDSAIEVVVALCETNRVWLSCRSAKFDRVKPKNLEAIEAIFAAGKCTPLWSTVVKEVREGSVVLEYKADKRLEEIPNEQIFAMIGGHPPVKFLEGIGVPYVEKPHSWSPPRTDELVKETAPPEA